MNNFEGKDCSNCSLPDNHDGKADFNFSLAEHSYCVSSYSNPGSSTSTVGEDHHLNVTDHDHINNLFLTEAPSEEEETTTQLFHGSNSEVYSPVGFSVELSDDINFDGFNFSVPSSASSKEEKTGGEDGSNNNNGKGGRKLESMWGGGTIARGILGTVEIHPTKQDTHDLSDSYNSNLERTDSEDAEDVTDLLSIKKSSRKRRIGRVEGRRGREQRAKKLQFPLFIQDMHERRTFLDVNFRKLSLKLKQAIAQTKCEGNLSAFYEGKIIMANMGCESIGCQEAVIDANLSGPSFDSVSGAISHEPDHSEMEDHRYAATMITQTINSSSIRDHQYNEQVFRVDQNFDGSAFDYIRGQLGRDRAFCELARSLFAEKVNLEVHTGAQIKIFLKYEGIIVTDGNVNFLQNLIKNKRGTALDKVIRSIAPGPRTNSEISGSPRRTPPSVKPKAATPLTLIIPNFDGFAMPIRIPFSYAVTDAVSTFQNSETSPVSTAEYSAETNGTSPILGSEEICEESGYDNGDEHSLDQTQAISTKDDSTILPSFSVPQEYQAVAKIEQSCLPSPPLEVTASRYVRDSTSNTEPICSICMNENSRSERTLEENTFWIRCNDPFCYDMVHTSCVGFMISNKSQLKQLPAFYCKSHR